MKTIGAILIIVGFLVGVVGGIRFSTRNAIISNSGNVDQGKQFQVSLIASVAVIMVLTGVVLFF
jgi:uncharacterized membrane protein YidH (DUF202 family)